MAVRVVTKKSKEQPNQPAPSPAPSKSPAKQQDRFIFIQRIRKVIQIMIMDVRVRFDPVLRKKMAEEYKEYKRFIELARKDQSSEEIVYGKAEKFWNDPKPVSKFSLKKLVSPKWALIFILTNLLINRTALMTDENLLQDIAVIIAGSIIMSPFADYLWNTATDAIGEVFGGKA